MITGLKQRLIAWMHSGFVPEARSRWEWFFMRLGLGAIVLDGFTDSQAYRYPAQPVPVGIAKFVDLSFLHTVPHMHEFMFGIVAALVILYVLGFGMRWSVTLLALASTVVRTYANSQGFTHHGYQTTTLCLIAQAIIMWWYWARSRHADRKPALDLGAYAIYYSSGLFLMTYVASALTKLINSRGLWVWNSQYFCLDMVKSHRTNYYAELDPALAAFPETAVWVAQHPWISMAMFGSGFFLELFAFVGLHSRFWALITGVSIIAFHQSVSALMQLEFFHQKMIALVLLVNVPWWTMRVMRRATT